jgi:cytochrome c556
MLKRSIALGMLKGRLPWDAEKLEAFVFRIKRGALAPRKSWLRKGALAPSLSLFQP